MARRQTCETFGIRLGRIARLWRAEIDHRLVPHGMTEAQWLTLLHLSRLESPTTQKMLAEAAGVREPTLVRMLDRLEADGLITRGAIEGDRRAKSVRLTAKAAPAIARIQEVTDALRDELLAGIDEADILACLRVFDRLSTRLTSGTIDSGGTGADGREMSA